MKYSNPSLRERTPGRWQVRFRYKERDEWKTYSETFDASGKRAAKRRATEIQAELEERAAKAQMGRILEIDDEELLTENFLERFVRNLEGSGAIEKTTSAGYRASAKHICRYLKGIPITEITAEMILSMQDKLLNKDGLCANSVAKDHRFLKQALSYAVEVGALAYSPFTKSVKAPKRTRNEPNALDDAGRARLLSALDAMADTDLTLGVRLALSAGLRREEICGLRWRDIDFDENVLHVRNVVTEAGGEVFEKVPKTECSRRTIPLEPDLKRRLLERRERFDKTEGFERTRSYVIGNAQGGWCTPSVLGRGFAALAKSLDARGITGKVVTLHDLRHTFATYLVARGVDIKTVASLMGHADATVTLNIYASADPKARLMAASIIEEAMGERPDVPVIG